MNAGSAGEGNALIISTKVYSLEAIKKALYRIADRASATISPLNESEVRVTFTFIGNQQPERVVADFNNELLDQDLREIVKAETGALRNLILAHAFSKTSLIDQG